MKSKIAVFISFSGDGGVERMVLNLVDGFAAGGCHVDLLVVKARTLRPEDLPGGVRLVKLSSHHYLSSLPALVRYLRRERPDALLAAKDRANRVAILARRLAGVSTRVVVRMGTTVSAALEGKGKFQKWIWYLPMRLAYPRADAVVAVSNGVATDLAKITGLPVDRFRVIANPVVSPKIFKKAAEGVEDPWFREDNVPVIIGIGRLTRQKDFSTLIRAFARLHSRIRCRLVLLGEGRDRNQLFRLAKALGVAADLKMPGFDPNPYRYLQRATLFVLSSAWEGSPNALTEALALGVPVVATDCPSGPREILRNGIVAPLVPVGDPEKLATAMAMVLEQPPEKAVLMEAAAPYSQVDSSRRYLETLLGPSK